MDEWKPILPGGLAVQQTATKGRGLLASGKSFKVGDSVLTATPIALVVSKDEITQYCHHCLKEKSSCDAGLLRCTQCKYIHYCSHRCQKQDWLVHKEECAGICRISPNLPTDSMRLLLRCLLVHQQRIQKPISLPTGAKWEMELLCSYSDVTKLESHSYMVKGAHLLLGEPIDFPFSFAMDVFCKISCNTFTVHNGELKSIGAAMYLVPSLLNHSCVPNCTICYDGCTLYVRVIEDIFDGQELLISYIDLLDTRQARRDSLIHPYGFRCSCTRCQSDNNSQESLDDLLESYTCPNCSQPILPSQGIIHKDCSCHELTDSALADEKYQSACRDLHKMANYRQEQNWETMKKLCKESLSMQNPVLYRLNIATVKTLEYLMDSCIESRCWQDAVDYSKVLTEAYDMYLPTYHPLKGVHLMKVGKIQLLITEKPRGAIETLYQAKRYLMVSHGLSHPLLVTTEALITEGRLALEPYLQIESS
ncbi:histone-lysine N-methyltransferase SMYD3-like [Dysidea avara]|uniref:histone-lysine N-methyltransferase SMYD3-like n=1 Tax=Dysidea avara TaxID=196820 RepID=UPI00331D89D4